MFDVILFLIENYFECGTKILNNKELIAAELELIDFFPKLKIQQAVAWLAGLEYAQQNMYLCPNPNAIGVRYFMPYEQNHIGDKGINLLLNLERIGILDNITRELVIDRLMALPSQEVDNKTIPWVVSIVLNHQPSEKSKPQLEHLLEYTYIDTNEFFH